MNLTRSYGKVIESGAAHNSAQWQSLPRPSALCRVQESIGPEY